MHIQEIHAQNVLPIKQFSAVELLDVVVLAGSNGVGKTRLMNELVNFFRSPSSARNVQLIIHATNEIERTEWGKEILDTKDEQDSQILRAMLQKNKRRSNWQSSLLQFESDRSIQQVQPFTFTWDYSDPFQENMGWDMTMGGLRSRFNDTIHSLFRKVRSHNESISQTAKKMRSEGHTSMELNWPDPLESFKLAFSQLLAPKQLVDPDPQKQYLEYEFNGQKFDINTLSSGEREVVNIVFDFLLRNPEDCVVLFDEPEIHLHPELSYRLLQTLRTVGSRNQFIFCTHSPDIITASLDQSVIFVAPATEPPQNQALLVKSDDETNQALQLLGQSVGIIALGKRIVLVEGKSTSLDKQTYGSILRNRFPNLVLVPSGGKDNLISFERIRTSVLERSIWGIHFFMLCDHDAKPYSETPDQLEQQAGGRFRVLPRYHLENYFFDTTVLASVFRHMEPPTSWLCHPEQIETHLKVIAAHQAAYAISLIVASELRTKIGNVDMMPKAVQGKSTEELTELIRQIAEAEKKRITEGLGTEVIAQTTKRIADEVLKSVESPNHQWKLIIPGKAIFNMFASQANIDSARLKQMYIAEVQEQKLNTFDEIVEIFSNFSKFQAAN